MDAKSLLKSAGRWMGSLIFIVACVRDNLRLYLILAWLFAVAIWIVFAFLIPYLKEYIAEVKENKQAKLKAKEIEKKETPPARAEDTVDINLFMIHINRRITDYLKISFPDATWQWCSESPEKKVLKYEVQRIKLYGCGEHTHAEICFDRCANLSCQLIKITPMETAKPQTDPKPVPENTVTDIRVWFEQSGKATITKIIGDFQSRGHSSMTITENGDCLAIQGNNALKYSTIDGMPKKNLWTELIGVLESEGIAANIGAHGLDLVW